MSKSYVKKLNAEEYCRNEFGVEPSSRRFSFLVPLLEQLPEPWETRWKDQQTYFWNPETRVCCWEHPCVDTLKQLLSSYDRIVATQGLERQRKIDEELDWYQKTIEQRIADWRIVNQDPPYFYHHQSKETRWSDPRKSVVAELNMIIDALVGIEDEQMPPSVKLPAIVPTRAEIPKEPDTPPVPAEIPPDLVALKELVRSIAPKRIRKSPTPPLMHTVAAQTAPLDTDRQTPSEKFGSTVSTLARSPTPSIHSSCNPQPFIFPEEEEAPPIPTEAESLPVILWMVPEEYLVHLGLRVPLKDWSFLRSIVLFDLPVPWLAKLDDQQLYFLHRGYSPNGVSWRHPMEGFFCRILEVLQSQTDFKDLSKEVKTLTRLVESLGGFEEDFGKWEWMDQRRVYVSADGRIRTDDALGSARSEVLFRLHACKHVWTHCVKSPFPIPVKEWDRVAREWATVCVSRMTRVVTKDIMGSVIESLTLAYARSIVHLDTSQPGPTAASHPVVYSHNARLKEIF